LLNFNNNKTLVVNKNSQLHREKLSVKESRIRRKKQEEKEIPWARLGESAPRAPFVVVVVVAVIVQVEPVVTVVPLFNNGCCCRACGGRCSSAS
jgi:hypothetical protein